jgi:multidrug resistance efflux pump
LDGTSPPSGSARDDEFTTIEAAERALEQAKNDLDRLAQAEPSPVVGRSRTTDRAAEKKADTAGSPPASAARAETKSAPSELCDNSCRAFDSLSRAAAAVCRIDGQSGAHCTRAKHIVSDSRNRVARCSCSVAED